MELTQEQIISEYKKLKLGLGHEPKSTEFYSKTNVTKHIAQIAFGSSAYTKIQSAAGDEPRKFGQKGRSKDEYFQTYGKFVRKLKKVPTEPDWKHLKVKPTVGSYRKSLKINWKYMPPAFIDWAIDKSEWKDVVVICTSHCRENNLFQEESKATTISHGYVYLMKANKKGQYKIGRTGSPGGRTSQLSQLDPHDRRYEHLFETNDPVAFENYWKEYRFKEKRISKEIFELSEDDIKAFKEFFAKKAGR